MNCITNRAKAMAVALLSTVSWVAAAATYTVPDGETWVVYGNGVDDSRNKLGNRFELGRGSCLEFKAGATFPTMLNVLLSIHVADGVATLKFPADFAGLSWLGSVTFGSNGSLAVQGAISVAYGYSDPVPTLDGAKVMFTEPGATGFAFEKGVLFQSLPSQFTVKDSSCVYQFASDSSPLFANNFALSANGLRNISVKTACSLPTGGSITIPTGCRFAISDTAAATWTVDLVLSGGTVVFDNGIDAVYDGNLTGFGCVELISSNLRLTHENYPAQVAFSIENGRILSFNSVNGAAQGGPMTVSLGEVRGNGCLSLVNIVKNQTVSIDQVVGQVTIVGSGSAVANSIDASGILRYRTGSTVSVSQPMVSTGAVVRAKDIYEGCWIGTDNGTLNLSSINVAPGYQMAVRLEGPVTLMGENAMVRVEAAELATVQLAFQGEYGQPIYCDGGKIVIQDSQSWKDKTILWLDASDSSSTKDFIVNYPYKSDSVIGECVVFTNGYHLIDRWCDKLRGDTSYIGYNDRHLIGNYFHPRLYPYRVNKGLNGLDYISCGMATRNNVSVKMYYGSTEMSTSETTTEQRRLPFRMTDSGESTSTLNLSVQYAVMVFGSQYGGGGSLLSTIDGELKRDDTTLSASITKNPRSMYIDGIKTDGSVEYFNGKWQIISVPMPGGWKVNGLGSTLQAAGGDMGDGGQNYAEVILFSEVLSDEQRIKVETYLAKKWGLLESYAGKENSVRIFGNGSIEAHGQVRIGGAFIGSMELGADADVESGSGDLPPTAEQLPEGRVTWFDPSDENSLLLDDASPSGLYAIYDREKGNVAGARIAIGNGARRPTLVPCDISLAGRKNWIDFNNYATGDTTGNTLRMVAAPNDGTGSTLSTANIRMAFVVQNSARGGGAPVVDTGVLNGTLIGGLRVTSDYSTPIWGARASAIVTAGTTYLDGVPVDGLTHGFQGRPELFAFSTTGDFPLACLGALSNSEGAGVAQGEILGESITFNRVLNDAERKDVEAYLMVKWLGMAPTGYTDLRQSVLSGTGSYRAESVAALPSIDSQYAGQLTIAQDSFAFTAAKSGVTGEGVSVPAGTLELPSRVNVTVDWKGRPRAGRYPLISANGLVGATSFTCTFVNAGQVNIPARFLVSDAGVELEVWNPGMTVTVR